MVQMPVFAFFNEKLILYKCGTQNINLRLNSTMIKIKTVRNKSDVTKMGDFC